MPKLPNRAKNASAMVTVGALLLRVATSANELLAFFQDHPDKRLFASSGLDLSLTSEKSTFVMQEQAPDARIRLVCFHRAGAAASEFRS